MLTKLRLKNWRSVEKAEIDLTPITVFIGANSSGKTNILDALYFLRESSDDGVLQAVQNRGGAEKVRRLDSELGEPVEVGFSFKPTGAEDDELTYELGLRFDSTNTVIPEVSEYLKSAEQLWIELDYGGNSAHIRSNRNAVDFNHSPYGVEETLLSVYGGISSYPQIYQTFQFITERWQLLDENFMPPLSLIGGTTGDLTVINRCADNVPIMLNFMQKTEPKLYEQLQDDLKWLLGHVDSVTTESNDRETRFALREKQHNQQEAPTISSGSARLVAMLTAVYALNMPKRTEMPGLVVIEEPDTALNPGILRNFVEQLRYYATGEHPRQFILTTHNPTFLDYFEPEEVRVVSRDEQGYTQVEAISGPISEIWLDEYGLGGVWTTNSFGGLAE